MGHGGDVDLGGAERCYLVYADANTIAKVDTRYAAAGSVLYLAALEGGVASALCDAGARVPIRVVPQTVRAAIAIRLREHTLSHRSVAVLIPAV